MALTGGLTHRPHSVSMVCGLGEEAPRKAPLHRCWPDRCPGAPALSEAPWDQQTPMVLSYWAPRALTWWWCSDHQPLGVDATYPASDQDLILAHKGNCRFCVGENQKYNSSAIRKRSLSPSCSVDWE